MRELWSRRLAFLTAVLVVALAVAAAARRNPPPGEAVAPPSPEVGRHEALSAERTGGAPSADLVATGRRVYERERCGRCHGVGGAGGGLDDVTTRLTAEEIAQWTLGAAEVEERLPRSAVRAKQRYGDLPAADLEALVAFLRSSEGKEDE